MKMKCLFFLPVLLLFSFVSLVAQQSQGYENPVLRGLNPDPSICSVGEDFYMVTSSMYLYPGVPIYKSKDLINWKLIGHCLTSKKHFFIDKNNGSPMMYAATIRYNKGTFYMITTDVQGGGNFFVTTKDPSGEWSDPVFIDQPVFDPSLFFDDDGKVYYTRRGDFKDKDIVQAEIDITTGKLVTPLKAISKGFVSDDTEGPHVFKREGWYYITMGEGGSRSLHMQTIGRSKSPWGPFKSDSLNPVITQNNAWWHHIRALGHADFIDAPDRSSWVVCLGTRHAYYDAFSVIGRETFLLPVTWENGWPKIKNEYKQKLLVHEPTLPQHKWQEIPSKDDFEKSNLALSWSLLAYPATNWYSLTERKGFLRLKGTAAILQENKQVAFVGTKQKEMSGTFSTYIEFKPESSNEEAGISIFQSGNFHYDIFITKRNNQTVTMLRKTAGDMVTETVPLRVNGKGFELKITFDEFKYHFLIYQNSEWKELGSGLANMIATEVAAVWSGVFCGMYSTGNGKACKQPADFDWFNAEFKQVHLVNY
jgi:xylan 1,4-beta-xylosidase